MGVLKEWKGKTALVTGASAGIGVSFARLLAQGGCRVIVTARREDRLNDLCAELKQKHGAEAFAVPHDLSKIESAKSLWKKVGALGHDIDLLINNAGFGIGALFGEADWERQRQMLQLNIMSLTELTKLALEPMLARGSGDILLVGSVGAFLPTPSMACYSASKAFVDSFGEALHYETKGKGVRVCVLNPGGVETEFMEVAGHKPKNKKLVDMGMAQPDDVAGAGLSALAKGKVSVIPGAMNAAFVGLSKVMPSNARLKVVAGVQKMLSGKD